ncbi:MAG: ATP-binding protein [Bacteroidota bacterium]
MAPDQLLHILTLSKDATAIYTGEDIIIAFANDAMLAFWSKGPDIIGMPLGEGVPVLKGQPFIDMLKGVWQTGKTVEGKDTPAELIINGEKQTRYFDFIYRAIKNPDGSTQCILHTATDVTKNVQTRADLANSQANARQLQMFAQESEHRYRSIIDQSPVAIIVFRGENLKIEAVNPFMLEVLGKSADILGRYLHDVFPELLGQPAYEMLKEVYRTGIPQYGAEVEIILKRDKVDEKSYFNFSYTPLIENGEIVGVLDTAMEVTKQVRAHQEIQQRKDDFISIASHELRTPITSLSAALQLLDRMKDDPKPEMMRKMIIQANRSSGKINRLVEDLLNVTSIKEGRMRISKTRFKLGKLLDECCMHVRSIGNFEVSIHGDTQLEVVADEHRIEQVVNNFVNNAIKYAPGSPSISLHISKIDNHVRVAVTDKGPGIAKSELPQLFDRFFRSGPSTEQYAGLGLGLYISAEIIKRHGGEIGADSKLGEGSTFWFTLPLN